MKVLVIGGTGVISRSIVEQLVAKQHQVTVYNRGSRSLPSADSVRRIVGDRSDRETFRETLQREAFDVAIDMIAFTEANARSTVETFRGRVQQLIICSTIAAYKRPYKTTPVQEDAESLADDPIFPYACNKASIERYLQALIRDESLPITIIRPSLTFGPGAANFGVLRQNYGVVERIRNAKPLLMCGDGNQPWSFTFAPDLAKAFVGAVGNPRTLGQHYHACSEERSLWKDLYLEIGRILGKEVRLFHLPSEVLYHAAPNLCAHLYFEKSFSGLFDTAKIRRDIPDFQPTISLHQGLRSLIAWFEAESNVVDAEKEALEDKLFEVHRGLMQQVAGLYAK
jgi:nucleoside-diphosphate-sugar epimerase